MTSDNDQTNGKSDRRLLHLLHGWGITPCHFLHGCTIILSILGHANYPISLSVNLFLVLKSLHRAFPVALQFQYSSALGGSLEPLLTVLGGAVLNLRLSAPGGSPEENSHAQPHPRPAQGHLGAEAGVGTPFKLLRWLGSTKRAEHCCAGKLHGQDSRPQPFVLTCGWGLYTLWSSTYNFLAGKTSADF